MPTHFLEAHSSQPSCFVIVVDQKLENNFHYIFTKYPFGEIFFYNKYGEFILLSSSAIFQITTFISYFRLTIVALEKSKLMYKSSLLIRHNLNI